MNPIHGTIFGILASRIERASGFSLRIDYVCLFQEAKGKYAKYTMVLVMACVLDKIEHIHNTQYTIKSDRHCSICV